MDLFTARCGCGVIYRPLRSQKACTDCQHRHAQDARAKLGTDRADTHAYNKRLPYQRPYTVEEIRQGSLPQSPAKIGANGKSYGEYSFDQVEVALGGKKVYGFQDGERITIEPAVEEVYQPRHLAKPKGGSMHEALEKLKHAGSDNNHHANRAATDQSFRALLMELQPLLQSRLQFGTKLGDLRHEAHCWLRERLPIHAQIIVTTAQDLGVVTFAIEVNGGRLGAKLQAVLTLKT